MKGETNDNELNSSTNNTLNYMNYDMKHVWTYIFLKSLHTPYDLCYGEYIYIFTTTRIGPT
jgi:hypothetical protein